MVLTRFHQISDTTVFWDPATRWNIIVDTLRRRHLINRKYLCQCPISQLVYKLTTTIQRLSPRSPLAWWYCLSLILTDVVMTGGWARLKYRTMWHSKQQRWQRNSQKISEATSYSFALPYARVTLQNILLFGYRNHPSTSTHSVALEAFAQLISYRFMH